MNDPIWVYKDVCEYIVTILSLLGSRWWKIARSASGDKEELISDDLGNDNKDLCQADDYQLPSNFEQW